MKFDLHVHTPFSDGQRDIDSVLKALIRQGVKIVGFADHVFPTQRCFSKSMLEFRKKVLRRYEKRYPQIRILVGGEIDLYPNGALSLPRGIGPEHFDYLLVAHHHTLPKQLNFAFKRTPKAERWAWEHSRYLRLNKHMWKLATYYAFSRYPVDIFAHPQEGIPRYMSDDEYKQFALYCKKCNVAIELNQIPVPLPKRFPNFVKKYHMRLDPLLDYAKQYHVKFSIASDFHGFGSDWEKRKLADFLDAMYWIVDTWDLELIDPTRFLPENRKAVKDASAG